MNRRRQEFVLCIQNRGYRASLIKRKIYRIMPDPVAETRGLLRVLDESGEDYLYPRKLFIGMELPQDVQKAFASAK